MVLTINPAFKDRRVMHHNVCKTVADHTAAELKDLAIEARKSGNTLLIECFEELPSLQELLADKTTTEIALAKEATPALTPEYNFEPVVTQFTNMDENEGKN